MARRLILDTGLVVAVERGRISPSKHVTEDDDVVMAAVTVAELRTGIELATDAHRASRTEFLLGLFQTLPVEPYALATAEAHGRPLAYVHRGGTQRGAHDLLIAATAVTTGRTVLTTDSIARFGDLPGVDCLTVP
jgi:tRNA(fMet)-specific endonuclease VapC